MSDNTWNRIIPRLLFGFLLLCLLPLAGLSWLHDRAFESALEESKIGALDNLADNKLNQIQAFLAERKHDAQLLARAGDVVAAYRVLPGLLAELGMKAPGYLEMEALYRQEVAVLYHQADYHDVLLIAPDGRVFSSIIHEPDFGRSLEHGDLQGTLLARAHRQALATGEVQFTAAERYEPSAERAAIFIVAPVLHGKEVLGTLALQLDLRQLTRVTADTTGLGRSGEVVLAQLVEHQEGADGGQEGLYVGPLRDQPQAEFKLRVALDQASPALQKALGGQAGRGLTQDYAGRQVVAAWRHLPELGWGMVVKTDAAEALAPVREMRTYTIGALLGLLLLVTGAALVIGRALVTPVRQLTAVTRRFAAGDLEQRVEPVGCSEYVQLAASFNQMADSLAEQQATLEQRVEERTRDLAASRRNLQMAQAVAKVGSWSLDPAGNGLSWSEETYCIFGVTDGNPLEFKDFLAMVHVDDQAAVEAAWQAALRGEPYDITHRILVDGQIKWVREQAEFVFDRQGQLASAVGTVQDVTRQKRTEIEYQAILRTTMDGFFIVDMEGRIIEVNAAYCELLGYSRQELLAMRIPDIEAAKNPEETKAHIEKIIETGSDRFETKHRGKDGRILDIEVSVNFMPIGGGRLVAFLRNISERKQAQQELLAAKQEAEAANRAKGEFLANMSHEIRTPMNAILGLTQLVLDSQLPPRQENFLRKAHTSAKALLGILNDILDYSKIEAGRLEINREPARVEEILQEVADLFAARVEEKGLELFLEIDPEVPAAMLIDPLRLGQVINNLLSNAVKFTETGEIHIRVELAGGDNRVTSLRISVRDTGIGLSAQQVERLFQAFTQADGSISRKYGGTGLGLSISRRLVELMGGEITVSSREGQGATFSFTIPAAVAEKESKIDDLQHLAGRRVLVVDDQKTARTILVHILERWGLATATAASGEEAVAKALEAGRAGRPYDFVLLDWRMPGMDGLEVARHLEQGVQNGELAQPAVVIMVTAYDRENLLAEAGPMRLDAVLAKPVTPSVLFDALADGGGAKRPAKAKAIPPEARQFPGARALLVEDNQTNQVVAAEFLRQRGLQVRVVNHGGEALAALTAEKFDVVLMDLHMPVMDGFEATRRIGELPAPPPVIAMTAAVMAEDRERSRAAGMVDFVAKPIDPDELVAVLGRWLPADQTGMPVSGSATPRPAVDKAPAEPDATEAHPASAGTTGADLLSLRQGFDLAGALRRLAGNRELLLRLLADFARRLAPAQNTLARQLQSGELAAVREQLHTLKGEAANLGAVALAAAAGNLEVELERVASNPEATPAGAASGPAGENGPLPGQGEFFTALAETLEQLSAPLQPDLADLADQAASQAGSPDPGPDREQFQATLQALNSRLANHELPPEELMTKLRQAGKKQGVLESNQRSLLARLLRELERLDRGAALATIAELQTPPG